MMMRRIWHMNLLPMREEREIIVYAICARNSFLE